MATKTATKKASVQQRYFEIKHELNNVKPEGRNDYQNFSYIKEEQVLDLVKPYLQERKLDYTFNFRYLAYLGGSESRAPIIMYKCIFSIYDIEDPKESIDYEWDVPLDKLNIQGFGGLTTYLIRYFFMKTLGIASDEHEPDKAPVSNNNQPQRRY